MIPLPSQRHEFEPQVAWFWFNANKAVNGEPRERQQAIRTLLDMAHNHEDDRLRDRADRLVSLREWGNVKVLVAGPGGGA